MTTPAASAARSLSAVARSRVRRGGQRHGPHHEGTGGSAAESVGGAGDEDTGHGMILPLVVVCRATDQPAPTHC